LKPARATQQLIEATDFIIYGKDDRTRRYRGNSGDNRHIFHVQSHGSSFRVIDADNVVHRDKNDQCL
ncbi:hypothetical protein AB6D25_23710, partial [Vibrio cyclitrophicus]